MRGVPAGEVSSALGGVKQRRVLKVGMVRIIVWFPCEFLNLTHLTFAAVGVASSLPSSFVAKPSIFTAAISHDGVI